MYQGFADSSDEEFELNDEDTKAEGVLFNAIKILRALTSGDLVAYFYSDKKSKSVDYVELLKASAALGLHDLTNRVIRSEVIYSKYLAHKKEKFPLASESSQEIINLLTPVFLPIIKLHLREVSTLDAKNVKTLFNWTFNPYMKVPDILSKLESKKLASFKEELLTAIRKASKNQVFKKLLGSFLATDLKHVFDEDSADANVSFIASILLEIRKIKYSSKAIKITNKATAFSFSTTLEMQKFGPISQSKSHVTVIKPSQNSCSKISTFGSYSQILSQIPKDKKQLQLFTSCVLSALSGKSWETEGASEDEIESAQSVASEFTQLFFVESVRNPATIMVFPIWLELLEHNSKAIFPMSKVGAVRNAREIINHYGHLLFRPFVLDYDTKNAKDSDELLESELSTLIEWLKIKKDIDYSQILKRAAELTSIVFHSSKPLESLVCRDLIAIDDFLKDLGYSLMFTEEDRLLLQNHPQESVCIKSKVKTGDAVYLKKKFKAIYKKYEKKIEQIQESIKEQTKILMQDQLEFTKQLFIAIEENFFKWYGIEISDELKITDGQIEQYEAKAMEYLDKSLDEHSPFAKKDKKRKCSEIEEDGIVNHSPKRLFPGSDDVSAFDISHISSTGFPEYFGEIKAETTKHEGIGINAAFNDESSFDCFVIV